MSNDETSRRTAKQIAASLKARADDYHFDRITYEQLGAGNRIDWREAESDPSTLARVLKILRT